MSPLLTRDVLDVMLAGLQYHDPTTAVLGMTPACHPDGGVDAVYKGQGILTLLCHTCQHDFARLPLLAGKVHTTGTQEPLS